MTQAAFKPGQAYDYPLILKKLLKTSVMNAPDRPIVDWDGRRFTYRELNERIHRMANALHDMGIRAGDTVAVLDYDSPRYLVCFFAIPMMGAVLQTVNWRLSNEQIVYTLNHAEAKAVIVHSDFLPILEIIRPSLETVQRQVLITEDDQPPDSDLEFDGTYAPMMDQATAVFDFPDLDEGATATTFYTTGTTGDPKGVRFSHRQLVLHTMAVSIALGAYDNQGRFRSSDAYMPLTPMFHVHAWGLPYVATLLGVKQVYPGKYVPEKLIKLIGREKVTFSHCVPTILQMLLASPAAQETDLSQWKVIIGGAKLSKGLAMAAREKGIMVFAGYGMSETCPVMSISLPQPHMADWDDDRKLDVVTKTGTPIPLAEIEVVDETGAPVPHDGATAGEVVFRAPWLTADYFKAPDKTRELWRNGYLHSGDVGHIDSLGYLQITDRIKDVIKTGGEWISSLDLENIMSQHEAVLESAAIGVSDDRWGERPLLLVVLKPEYKGKAGPEDLVAYMRQAADQGRLPKYGVPDKIVIMESLAKTSVGKLDKKRMRQEFH